MLKYVPLGLRAMNSLIFQVQSPTVVTGQISWSDSRGEAVVRPLVARRTEVMALNLILVDVKVVLERENVPEIQWWILTKMNCFAA